MPLTIGTVTVTAGVPSGTGLAREVFDSLREAQGVATGPQNHVPLQELAKFATAIVTPIVNHFKANGQTTATANLTVAPGIAVTCPPYSGSTIETGTATGTVTGAIS